MALNLKLGLQLLFASSLAFISTWGLAAPASLGSSFQHKDWQLACDNTLTCRAAGYQQSEEPNPVSVLLTRKAGKGQPLKGMLQIGHYELPALLSRLSKPFPVRMYLNGKNYGDILINTASYKGKLSQQQTKALASALSKSVNIEFVYAEQLIKWHLSDRGAAAVLLKMDEFQGRLNTANALIKKGNKSAEQVFPAKAMPVIQIPKLPVTTLADRQLIAQHKSDLVRLLTSNTETAEECDLFSQAEEFEFEFVRISATQFLLSSPCWMAAYNGGNAYWLLNDSPPFQAQLITVSGSEFSKGELLSHMKGRGLGDCWDSHSMAWDGQKFVDSHASTTGWCRFIAPGGAWYLPTLKTKVSNLNQ